MKIETPMHPSFAHTALAGLALIAGSLASATHVAAADPVVIRFDARAGEQPLACGTPVADIGSTQANVQLQDFRIYVSQVRLIDRQGGEHPFALTPDGVWQSAEVALLDFENATGNCNGNPATNTVLRGTVEAGDYVGLVFDIGVPVALNHQDPTLAEAPLNFSALTWAWRYGYKFTTIDLETGRSALAPGAMAGHGASGFSIHLGSVDCGSGSPRVAPESPCATPNRATIRLANFDPAREVVVFDLAALLADTDVTVNTPDTPSGCMSGDADTDCVGIFDRLGLTFRGQPSQGQQFVRAAPAP
jgi:uncharacterized repeat protein (TIGR04052 family)